MIRTTETTALALINGEWVTIGKPAPITRAADITTRRPECRTPLADVLAQVGAVTG